MKEAIKYYLKFIYTFGHSHDLLLIRYRIKEHIHILIFTYKTYSLLTLFSNVIKIVHVIARRLKKLLPL